jgi:hypothetical protein
LEKEITQGKPNEFTFLQFYDLKRDESSMKNKIKNEEETQGEEEGNEENPRQYLLEDQLEHRNFQQSYVILSHIRYNI